jgi:hypothetical protein
MNPGQDAENIMENPDMKKETALLDAVKSGLAEGARVVAELNCSLKSCADNLRIGQSAQVMAELTQAIGNLALLSEFIGELRRGLQRLRVTVDVFPAWNDARDVFQGMVSALESRDWVTLSDMIEYELSPMLEETQKCASDLAERLGIRASLRVPAEGHQSRSTI